MPFRAPISSQIESVIESIPGWTPSDQLLSLFILAQASAGLRGDILELGSWCGRSAVVLGMAARLAGNCKVHCVDLFPERADWSRNADGYYSFVVYINGKSYGAYGEQTVWAEPFERDIVPVYERFSGTLDAFNRAIDDSGLNDWVASFRGDLAGFAKTVASDFALRLAFIDGDHSYSAVARDIEIVERFLVPGGWICFDDAFSSYSGVNEAIEQHIIGSGRYSLCQQLTRKFFVARRKAD
jgi:predicted O-methyltransferase YrrM